MTAGGLDLTFLPSFQCVHLGLLPSSSTWTLCSGREGGLSSQGRGKLHDAQTPETSLRTKEH